MKANVRSMIPPWAWARRCNAQLSHIFFPDVEATSRDQEGSCPPHRRRCGLSELSRSPAGLTTPAIQLRRLREACRIIPKLGGDDIVAEHVKIHLGIAMAGGVAAMFTTLAFFLIAVLLTLGIIVDSLWGRFQRR